MMQTQNETNFIAPSNTNFYENLSSLLMKRRTTSDEDIKTGNDGKLTEKVPNHFTDSSLA